MARKGFFGIANALVNSSISFFIRNPAARMLWLTPTMLECARWAVPNASLMYLDKVLQ
jgi:hypothetical protein